MQSIYQQCFARDGFKCRHCSNRNGIHPHHVLYRSHGGADTLNNLITLCARCHIDGVHGGNLKIEAETQLVNDIVVKFIRRKGWKP